MKKLLFILIIGCSLASCQSYKRNANELLQWHHKANIYEILPLQYPDTNGFTSLISHRAYLRKLFINTIALLPITSPQEINEPYSISNPYKVKDFYKINPKLGTAKDFAALLDSFHNLKIKCLLEFDFSITALDHPWRSSNPEFYKVKELLDNKNLPANYLDLDHTNSKVQNELLKVVNHWLKSHAIDGLIIRGLAHSPKEFVRELYNTIAVKNNSIFISDANTEHLSNIKIPCGILNQELQDKLISTYKNTVSTSSIINLIEKSKTLDKNLYFVNFTHSVSTELTIGSMQQTFDYQNKLMAVLSQFVNGVPMIFNGQECPIFEKIDFTTRSPLNLKYQYHSDFYRALFLHRFYNEAFQVKAGENTKLIIESDCVVGIKRSFGNQYTILIANLCATPQNYQVNENLLLVSELFSHAKLKFEMGKVLPLNGYQFLVVTNKY